MSYHRKKKRWVQEEELCFLWLLGGEARGVGGHESCHCFFHFLAPANE